MNTRPVGVAVDYYDHMKKEYKEWGVAEHFIPVDLNGAFVPLEKNAKGNFETAGCNAACRFGLCSEECC